jgi:hypothetical protein
MIAGSGDSWCLRPSWSGTWIGADRGAALRAPRLDNRDHTGTTRSPTPDVLSSTVVPRVAGVWIVYLVVVVTGLVAGILTAPGVGAQVHQTPSTVVRVVDGETVGVQFDSRWVGP